MWFSKVFQNLVSPFPIIVFLMILSVFLGRQRKKWAELCLWTALSLSLILSNRTVSHLLLRGIEGGFPSREYSSYPDSDIAVVLGGSLTPYLVGHKNLEENSGSRLIPAYILYRMKKIKKIIVSGGNPYLTESGETRTESQDMKDFLVSLGVHPDDIVPENQSRNTEENARAVAKILAQNGWKTPLLITSAFHMRRSIYFFSKNEVKAIPVAVAHRAFIDPRFWYLEPIPSAVALEMSSQALKEHLGYLWALVKS